jgi:lysophospholipase L1-like esterase
MDEVYGRTVPTDPDSRWDFARWVPQAVVINLGTNDFAGAIPDRKGWTDGYRAFLTRVRKNAPHAVIYCASSPMLWGDKDTLERSYLRRIVQEEAAAGDKNIRFLDFKTQDAKDGFGADWHPSVKTHQIMAGKLAATLQADLKWTPTVSAHKP